MRHGRHLVFQMTETAVPRHLLAGICGSSPVYECRERRREGLGIMRTLFVEGGARFPSANGWQRKPKQAIVSLAEGALPDRTVNAVLAAEPRVQSRPRPASADPGSPAPPRKSGRARRAPEGRSERHAPIGMRRSR